MDENDFIFCVLHKSQGESRIRNFFYGISGNNFQPLHQHLILVCADLQCFLLCAGPSEVPVFNPLVQKEKSVPFLSEYSDKKGYPQPFVIRIFLPFILRYARFPGKNMRIKIILARRCGQVHLHHPAIPDLRIQ